MAYNYDKNLEFLKNIPTHLLKDLADLLGVKNNSNKTKYVEKIIEELQLFGGDTIENIIEGSGVSYRIILCDVCSALNVNYEKYWDIELIERSLLDKVLDDNKDLIHKKGHEHIIKDIRLSVFDKIKLSVKNVFSKSSRPTDNFYFVGLNYLNMNDIKILAKKFFFPNKGDILTGPAYRKTVPAVLQIALLRANNTERNVITHKRECVELVNTEEQNKLIKTWNANSDSKDDSNTPIIVDLISKSTAEITRDVAVIKEGVQLLKCSVSPELLTKAKDGTGFLGIIHGENGIVKHARFNTADLSKVVTPALLYNAASIALGCHFMIEIKKELGNINKKLDEILKLLEDKEKSKIKSFIGELREISFKKYKSSSDENILRQIKLEADSIRELAMKMIEQDSNTNKAITWLNIYTISEKVVQYSQFLLWQYFCEIGDKNRAQEQLDFFLENESKFSEEYKKLPIDNLRKAYHFAIKNDASSNVLKNLLNLGEIFNHKTLSQITANYYICCDKSTLSIESK